MSGLVTHGHTGPVAVITLEDPAHRNVLSARLVSELADHMDEAEADPRTRAVVLTGAGTSFCAGADLATLESAASGDFGLIRQVYSGFLRVRDSPLLTVAAVNGPAVGAGFNLALACDLRVAAQSARFVCRFPELGLFPGGGHLWMLQRAVGYQRALTGVLLGESWDATAALQDGLVVDVVASDSLMAAVLERLGPLAELGAGYVRQLVEHARQAVAVPDHRTALELEAAAQEWSIGQPEFLDKLERARGAIGRHKARRAGGGGQS